MTSDWDSSFEHEKLPVEHKSLNKVCNLKGLPYYLWKHLALDFECSITR